MAQTHLKFIVLQKAALVFVREALWWNSKFSSIPVWGWGRHLHWSLHAGEILWQFWVETLLSCITLKHLTEFLLWLYISWHKYIQYRIPSRFLFLQSDNMSLSIINANECEPLVMCQRLLVSILTSEQWEKLSQHYYY